MYFQQETSPPYPPGDCITLPVYYDSTREKLVTCFSIPCGGKVTPWIQCGAAIFLKNTS